MGYFCLILPYIFPILIAHKLFWTHMAEIFPFKADYCARFGIIKVPVITMLTHKVALPIFSQFFEISCKTLDHYLSAVSETNNIATNTTEAQNYYCDNQKQNPHTPRVMASLGLNEEDVRVFIQDCLFPEIT